MSTVTVLNTDAGLTGKTLINAEDTQTVTGSKTFSRNPGAPFVVTAGSANVPNLDADKVDGSHATVSNGNRVLVSSGSTITEAAALTNGQLLIGSTGAAPVGAAVTAGTGITVTNGAGSLTVGVSASYIRMTSTGTKAVSAANQMMGFGAAGATFTPAVTGNVLIHFVGYTIGNSSANNAAHQIYTGTGSAPANGAALTGSARGTVTNATPSSAAYTPLGLVAYVSGLSLSTAYWVDLGLSTNTGTQTITTTMQIVVIEV